MVNLFFTIVVPILEVASAVLVMISTLLPGWNFYTDLMARGEELKQQNKELFSVFRVDLICARCKDTDFATDCRHKVDEIPPWKSEEKLDIVRVIMGDRMNILKTESMGVVDSASGSVFDATLVRKFQERKEFDHTQSTAQKPKICFLSIDPNAGGTSDVALTLLVRHDGKTIVAGMDSRPCTHWIPDFRPFFSSFLANIRLNSWLKHAWIIVACERNTGYVSGNLEEVTSGIPKVYTLYEDVAKPAGIFTDPAKKNLYAVSMRKELSRGGGSLYFMKDFVVALPSMSGGNISSSVTVNYGEHRIEVKRKMLDQIRRAHWEINEEEYNPKKPQRKPRHIGWNAKERGQNDDLVVCAAMGLHTMDTWEERGFTNGRVPYREIESHATAA